MDEAIEAKQTYTFAFSGTRVKRTLSCFIIMPFSGAKVEVQGEDKTLEEKDLKFICEEMFEKAVKSYEDNEIEFDPVKRYRGRRGNFVKGIVAGLKDADLVIADLTGLNPNVCYELGVRHTLRNGTIIVTQAIDSLPSDLRSYLAVAYRYCWNPAEHNTYYPTFEREMHEAIKEFLTTSTDPDNPVRDFIGNKEFFSDTLRVAELKKNIDRMEILKREYAREVTALMSTFEQWADGEKTIHHFGTSVDLLLQRLYNLNEDMGVIAFLKQLKNMFNVCQHNKVAVKLRIQKKEYNQLRNIQFGFQDAQGVFHHFLDLKEFYRNSSKETIRNEPILESFDHFISAWRKDLAQIMSKQLG